ncbi:MAG: hypothetical protein M3Z41_01340 [Candidatus Eremiobacteraeota bacterium]|nr:hypothetical protein [Candidatus Eremiobacteraeota bacterium]
MSWLSASPAGAVPPRALHVDTASPSASALTSDGLTIGRIFDSPSHGDIISFTTPASPVMPVAESVFGFSLALPPSERAAAARFFAASVSDQRARGAQASGGAGNQFVGMQFDLPGRADVTASLQSSPASFGSGPYAAIAGPEPAVFAFYNFPQSQAALTAGGAFGLSQQDAALAAPLSATQASQSAMSASLSSSPLISSLSAQGPFWYSAYAPAMRGTSLTLSIPFKLARVPVKVRVGEQAVSAVQSSSLATQILGPALASSAASKYNELSGGVTLALPLLSRRATVSLDGWYETLQHGDKMPFNLLPYASQTAAGVAAAVPGPVVYTPNATDIQQYVGAASVALPVTASLTVNGSFSKQVSGSVALDALTQSLTQRKTAYGGGVAYSFPKTNSSIDLFFNKNVYTNDNIPAYQFTENRQNLYFSVKF